MRASHRTHMGIIIIFVVRVFVEFGESFFLCVCLMSDRKFTIITFRQILYEENKKKESNEKKMFTKTNDGTIFIS